MNAKQVVDVLIDQGLINESQVADILRQALLLPVTVLEGIVTFFVPIVVLVDRLVRRSWRSALEAAVTAAVAALLVVLALWLLDAFAPPSLANGLSITSEGRTGSEATT